MSTLTEDEMTDEDAANIGRALMERLPKGYSWSNCPTEIVTDLQNEIHDLKELLREAVKIVHCHARNIDKDWLMRARTELGRKRL